jgi:hypothetical protein
MDFSMRGNNFSDALVKLIQDAKHLNITTVAGTEHHVYEPIHIGHNYVSFRTSNGGMVTLAIRWEAIATVRSQPN